MSKQMGPQGKMIVSKLLVSPLAAEGYYTTLSEAMAAAVAGDTIVLKSGTYTENITLKNGVNICCIDGGELGSSNVKIIGKLSDAGSGVDCCIKGISLQTNGDYALESTGAGSITLIDCFVAATNNSAIHINNSSANVYFENTDGDVSSATSFWNVENGNLWFFESQITNTGMSTVQSNIGPNGGVLIAVDAQFQIPISCSTLGVIGGGNINTVQNCTFDTSDVNVTPVTITGQGTSNIRFSNFSSGTASGISVQSLATLNLVKSEIKSSNAVAITGAGTLNFADITYTGTSSTLSPSLVQSAFYTDLGKYKATQQPGFLAFRSTNATNQTGAGAAATIVFDSTTYNFGAVFNTATGVFTAPITGIYQFNTTVRMGNISGAMTIGVLTLSTTTRTYRYENSPANSQNISGNICYQISTTAVMFAGDVASVVITLSNGAGNTATVTGSTTLVTWFSGELLS